MKNILKITIALAFIISLTSCWSDKTKPNYQYMPDMYKSVGYETYSEKSLQLILSELKKIDTFLGVIADISNTRFFKISRVEY
jgi:ABC-type uncharacterized transport system auxiliary subunit